MKKSIYLIALLVFAIAIPVSAETVVDKLVIRGQVYENVWTTGVDTDPATPGNQIEWNVANFAGFFYDIDEAIGTESIVATFSSDTEIKEDNLKYISYLDQIDYEFAEYGLNFTHENKTVTEYPVIGWNAEKYFAIKGDAQRLSKVIYEHDATETKTLVVGEPWYLGEGYTLTAKEIDLDVGKVWLSLAKDGVEVESEEVPNKSFMVEDKDFGGKTDVVYFVTYVDAVFRGVEANMTQLKYTWLVSDNVNEIKNGDTYGELEASGSSSSKIQLINKDSAITLDQDEEEELFGGLYLKVADDKDPGGKGTGQDIRFYLAKRITEPGTYKIRGQVYEDVVTNNVDTDPATPGNQVEWNKDTFGGFYYDIDENIGTEKIVANFSSDTEIKENQLQYISTLAHIDYESTKDGHVFQYKGQYVTEYPVIGWQGEKYFVLKDDAQKLSKVIYEQDSTETKTLVVGEAWDLGDGYTLTAKQINGSKVGLSLAKDGVEVESEVVNDGDFMVEDKDFGGKTDVVYFVTYVEAVFRGTKTNMIQLKYTWLVSDQVTEIKNGDTYGELEASGSSSEKIRLINKDSAIILDQDEEEPLFGGLYLKVADDKDPGGKGLGKDIRFYLAKKVTVGAPTPHVEIPKTFTLNLQDGWNLISLPLVPTNDNEVENTSIDYILSGLSGGSVERILTYDASTKLWKEYPNGTPLLTDMKTGIGYFLKMNGSATLTLNGVEIYNNIPRSYDVVEGWNLIGYHSTSTIPVESALNSIEGNYSSLWMLDNIEWKSYIAGDFQNMQPGKGYWIYMNSKGVIPQV